MAHANLVVFTQMTQFPNLFTLVAGNPSVKTVFLQPVTIKQRCIIVGLINTPGFDMATQLKPTNQGLAVYNVAEQTTCTVGQQEGRPPCCILTREINWREEEEKTDGGERRRMEVKGGEMGR